MHVKALSVFLALAGGQPVRIPTPQGLRTVAISSDGRVVDVRLEDGKCVEYPCTSLTLQDFINGCNCMSDNELVAILDSGHIK